MSTSGTTPIGGFRTGEAGAPAQPGPEELLALAGFSAEDAERLRTALPTLRASLPSVAARFYENLLSAPQAGAVFQSPTQVERLKQSMVEWVTDLLAGPHDDAFFERQRKAGQVHVRYGVPPRYVQVAMSALRHDLESVFASTSSREQASDFASALDRVTSVGLATMMDAYIRTHEARELDALQGVLVSNMPATVLLIDARGLVASAAAPDTRLFEEDRSVRRHFLNVLPQPLLDAARLESHVARALDTGREITLPRVDVEGEDGVRSFRISVVPLQHARARVLIHLADLTDVIQAESRARQSETLAQLGAFSAAVAHELRNPLAGISGALQVISRSFDGADPRSGVMEKVDAQIRRLDAMVSDLLALAKPAEPTLSPIDLNVRARAMADLMAKEHPRIEVSVHGEGRAFADPTLVDQILLNLLQNAGAAMRGQGVIRVELGDGRIAVRDSGPGVPTEHRRRIFEPFFTTRSRGTGLGLAICRRAAESMGAELELVDSHSPGACFILRWSR